MSATCSKCTGRKASTGAGWRSWPQTFVADVRHAFRTLRRTPSFALAVTGRSLDRLAEAFRRLPIPVIGRIQDGTLLFDLRTLDDEAAFVAQLPELAP